MSSSNRTQRSLFAVLIVSALVLLAGCATNPSVAASAAASEPVQVEQDAPGRQTPDLPEQIADMTAAMEQMKNGDMPAAEAMAQMMGMMAQMQEIMAALPETDNADTMMPQMMGLLGDMMAMTQTMLDETQTMPMGDMSQMMGMMGQMMGMMAQMQGMTGSAMTDRQAEVAARGAEVMPFDLEQTIHVFTMLDDGGLQQVLVKAGADVGQVTAIQMHLTEEAERFRQGDFDDPAQIHGEDMPGLAVLRRRAGEVDIRYTALSNGAQLQYISNDPELVTAIHDWFGAQLADHGVHATGSMPLDDMSQMQGMMGAGMMGAGMMGATGIMTGTTPITGTMPMGDMGQMMGMMTQMMGMMSQMQGMMGGGMMGATGVMTGTTPITGTMPMGDMGQMMPMMAQMMGMMSQMQGMMGATGVMTGTTPITGTMPMGDMGQMMGMMAQMMGMMSQMQGMMGAGMMGMMGAGMMGATGVMTGTTPITGTMPMTPQMQGAAGAEITPEADIPAQDPTQTAELGAITIKVTPVDLTGQDGTLDFTVVFDTHSVELDMDFSKSLALQVGDKEILPAAWESPSSGGHHVSGTVTFPAVDPNGESLLAGSTQVSLTVRIPNREETRSFTWDLNR